MLWLEALRLYAFFCLVTSIGFMVLTASVFLEVKPSYFTWGSIFGYFGTTALISFLGAPVFFIIFIVYSKEYKEALYNHLVNGE